MSRAAFSSCSQLVSLQCCWWFFSCFVFHSLFFLSDTRSFGAINIIVSQDSLRNWCFMRMYLIILFWSIRIIWSVVNMILISSMRIIWRSKKRGFFFYLPLPPAPFVSSPEKLDVEKVVSIDQLKKKISPALLYKETYLGAKEGKWC